TRGDKVSCRDAPRNKETSNYQQALAPCQNDSLSNAAGTISAGEEYNRCRNRADLGKQREGQEERALNCIASLLPFLMAEEVQQRNKEKQERQRTLSFRDPRYGFNVWRKHDEPKAGEQGNLGGLKF